MWVALFLAAAFVSACANEPSGSTRDAIGEFRLPPSAATMTSAQVVPQTAVTEFVPMQWGVGPAGIFEMEVRLERTARVLFRKPRLRTGGHPIYVRHVMVYVNGRPAADVFRAVDVSVRERSAPVLSAAVGAAEAGAAIPEISIGFRSLSVGSERARKLGSESRP